MVAVQPVTAAPRGRVRRALLVALGALVSVGAAGVGQAQAAVVNNPPVAPHVINVFPQRDFVRAEGYTPGESLTVAIQHSWLAGPVGTVTATVGDDGALEINHPGGACWVGVTPDIRPGDLVNVTDANGVTDQTTTASVTAHHPVQTAADTVEVHGTAVAADGGQIPVAQLAQRLVAPNDLFIKTGKRTLRADSTGTDTGTLAYDGVGNDWTATYAGLDPEDVTRALNAQSVGIWLGGAPAGAVATESTSFEVGAGIAPGPAAPCAAPKETGLPAFVNGVDTQAPTAPGGLTATLAPATNTVKLSWSDSTDNVGVVSYGVYRNGVAIGNVQRPDGAAPAPTAFEDTNVPPGRYVYTVDAQDAGENRSDASLPAPITLAAVAGATVAVNEPPVGGVSMIAFPSRDFVSTAGFAPDDTVNISIIRNGKVVGESDGLIPVDDPSTPIFDGTVEVNHPGGGCWAGTTPELRANDIVQATAFGPKRVARSINRIHVANIGAEMGVADPNHAGTVIVHGFAQGHDGKPLPADAIEHRFVSSTKDPFDANGRRTIRAPGEGTISYDTTNNPTGTKWTAVYSGLSAADVERATHVESRGMWLGTNPLANVELTIAETGLLDPPGPAPASCTSPIETPDTTAPTAPTATAALSGTRDVKVSWSGATDDTYVYGYRVLRDGTPVALLGAAGSTYTDVNPGPGPHGYTVVALDSASPRGAGASIIEQLQAGQGRPYSNASSPSNTATLTLADVTAPSVPVNLSAKVTADQVALTWAAATDDVGVAKYRVYRGGVKIADVTSGTSFTDTAPAVGSFTYTVDAVDGANNASAQSAPLTVNVTSKPDKQAPTVPANVAAAASPDVHGKDIKVSWAASRDTVGVAGYRVYRDGTKIADVNGTTLAYIDAARPAGTYGYTVDAIDSAGNASAQSASVDGAVANDPPVAGHAVIVFPSRDFVSATGYSAGNYVVDIYRNNARVFSSDPITAEDDPTTPGFDGLVEVNHGGNGGCWFGTTPDLRVGDVVRLTRVNDVSGRREGAPDQTTTANVTAMRPIQTAAGTVVVHGTAQDATGAPIDVSQLESRLITSTANQFSSNGRRVLRTGVDGTIAYDAAGSTKWTATFTGLPATDVTKALGATVTGMWLGRAPLAVNETTTFENGPGMVGGPAAAPCGPALEGGRPLATIGSAGLDWGKVNPSTTSTKTVQFRNSGTSAMAISSIYIAGADYPSAFSVSANTCGTSLAANTTCTVTVRFAPGTTLGPRSASLNFADNAADDGFQSIPLSGEAFLLAAPTAVQQIVAGGVNIGTPGTIAAATLPIEVSWLGTADAESYELQESKDGGATFTTVQTGTAVSATRSILMGTLASAPKYQYRVRALKGTLQSAWVSSGAFTVNAFDDKDTINLKWGGTWSTETVAGNYGGSVHFTSSRGSNLKPNRITFTTVGSFAIIGAVGPAQGQIQVTIDGKNTEIVDEYAAAADARKATVVYANNGIGVGQHDVAIDVPGTKNNLSTGSRIDLDGVVFLK